MIGSEASNWLSRMKRLLCRYGSPQETLCIVAEAYGPLCKNCMQAMEKSIRED